MFIAPALVQKYPQFAGIPYDEMVKNHSTFIDFAKIASIERERDKQFEKDLKDWEEANPEEAKKHLKQRYTRNAVKNGVRRRRRQIMSNKYQIGYQHGFSGATAVAAPMQFPAPQLVESVTASVPMVAIPKLNLPIFETVNTIKPPVVAQQVVSKDSKLGQMSMAVEFMVKDENHKNYLLYLLAANDFTKEINSPIRIHAFMGAANYLCDEKLFAYLKAIDEKI